MNFNPSSPTSYELIHYTKSTVSALDLSRTYPQTPEKLAFHTPNGLWVSVTGINDWERYCIKNNYRLNSLKSEFQIFPKPAAKILILYNKTTYEEFEAKYSYYADKTAPQEENYTLNLSIAWDRIITDYQGIIVPTALKKLYNMGLWYDTWCCTSGCIWDLQAVEKTEKIL